MNIRSVIDNGKNKTARAGLPLAVLLFSLFISSSSLATISTSWSPSTAYPGQTQTFSWSASSDYEDCFDPDNPSNPATTGTSGSYSVTAGAPGAYTASMACFYVVYGSRGVPIDGGESFASATRTVVAQPQPPVATAPPSARTYTGFTDDYQALLSTVNGTTIVLTTNTNGVPSIGDIELVWNSSTGSYRPQILGSVTGTWQSVAIDLVLGDFNVDGFVDAALKNLDSIISAIPNLADQIAFANPIAGQSPLAVTAVDEEFQMFFRDVYNWMQDETYFDAANISVELPSYEYHIIYDASLCFANFRISFFSFPVCYSHKMVLASAEYTLNSASINELLPYLSDPDFYALAGEALQGIFETEYAMQLAPYNSGEFSGCKRYCGAFYGVGYAQRVYDIFVPSTRTTEVFDREHYSLSASKIVDILDTVFTGGETAVANADVEQIEDTLGHVIDVQIDLPIPSDVPDDDVKPKKLGWFGRFLWLLDLIQMAAIVNEIVNENRLVFHYTSAGAKVGIDISQQLINPTKPIGGDVFFTRLAYPSSDIAMDRLGICGAPKVGFYILKSSTIPGLSGFTPVGSVTCLDTGEVRSGGGPEATAPGPISTLGARFIPIVKSLGN